MSTDKFKADSDNRSNQLNPNNEAYEKSRQNNKSNSDDDFADNETYGDDWGFHHD